MCGGYSALRFGHAALERCFNHELAGPFGGRLSQAGDRFDNIENFSGNDSDKRLANDGLEFSVRGGCENLAHGDIGSCECGDNSRSKNDG